MSDFVDYNASSKGYDHQRAPIAVEQILESIEALTGREKSDVHVLDAGCGTGNYTLPLLHAGIGKISMFDASEGMLQCAKDKLSVYQKEGRIGDIKQALLPTIPFGDGLFDVVMINMVLHHMAAKDLEERKEITASVFREVARVLKQGGAFIMTTCFPEQYAGFWYANIVPEVTERISVRFASRETLLEAMSDTGFSLVEFQKVLGSNWARNYFDAEGPLKKEWRYMDSYWSMFTDDELETALATVEEMKVAGTLNQFMLDNDKSMTEGNIVLMKAAKQ